MFADITMALQEVAKKLGVEDNIVNFANLDTELGLPRVRQHAEHILADMHDNVKIDEIIGGLDEYPIAGQQVRQLIEAKYRDFDFAVIAGVPHAIPMEALEGMELISITNGPRQVYPLKDMGHEHVLVEIDLHPKTLGVTNIVESEFGATMRQLALEE
jgi:nitrogenase molybdenum-iron protein alpha/beta subunit